MNDTKSSLELFTSHISDAFNEVNLIKIVFMYYFIPDITDLYDCLTVLQILVDNIVRKEYSVKLRADLIKFYVNIGGINILCCIIFNKNNFIKSMMIMQVPEKIMIGIQPNVLKYLTIIKNLISKTGINTKFYFDKFNTITYEMFLES